MAVTRIERVVTSGIFSLDGEDFEVDNNIWLVGDDDEVLVIDAAHDPQPIVDAVGGRRVVGDRLHPRPQRPHQRRGRAGRRRRARRSCCTPTTRAVGARLPRRRWDQDLADGDELPRRRPRAPGAAHARAHPRRRVPVGRGERGSVFCGDTLFNGGPGATGRCFSSFPTIIESIRTKLLTLPPDTVVHTGHGDDTRIGDEAPHLDEWIARGS